MSRRQVLTRAAQAGGSLVLAAAGCRRVDAPPGDSWAGGAGGAVARLRSSITGEVITPDDPRYEDARRVSHFNFNPTTDRFPSLIVFCASAEDVMRALEFARTHALEIAVRSGGNDVLGESVSQGGLVIDLSRLNAITIDPTRRVAMCGSGARAQDVNVATQAHGLAVPLGCHPAIGVGGLTLGGGLGWLLGKYGATCDNLLAAEIVTADGQMLSVDTNDNPELFWAVRGGGGNFGIATNFVYRAHPVGRVLGGYLAYDGERSSEFLRFYPRRHGPGPRRARGRAQVVLDCRPPDGDRVGVLLRRLRAG